MTISTPKDKCHYKMHKGFTYSEVYQFHPSYIEWLIINTADFIIDIPEFEALPIPTPYIHWIKFGKHDLTALPNESGVKLGKKEVAAGKKLKESPFKFGKELHIIIEQKNEGTYTPPEWERIIYEPIDTKAKSDVGGKDNKA
jgi:hypothetical protein